MVLCHSMDAGRDTMRWWGYSNPTLCKRICLNFLHSQVTRWGMKKLRSWVLTISVAPKPPGGISTTSPFLVVPYDITTYLLQNQSDFRFNHANFQQCVHSIVYSLLNYIISPGQSLQQSDTFDHNNFYSSVLFLKYKSSFDVWECTHDHCLSTAFTTILI